jgi:site-specific DNA recombinase
VEIDGKPQLEINEAEAKTVRLIFEWYTCGDGEQGPISVRAIAKKLSELRIPTYSDLRKKGDCTEKTVSRRGQWGRSSVGSILANETYTGTWYYGRRNWDPENRIAVDVPVIVDAQTWELAQERRKKNKREAKRNRKYDYLLAGKLTCGRCGRTMIGTPTYSYYKGKRCGRILYYRCQASARGHPCTIKKTTFRVEYIDTIAWEWIKEILGDQENLGENLRAYQEQRDELVQPLRARLDLVSGLMKESQTKLDRLIDLYLNGDFERDILEERKARIEAGLAGLEGEQARLLAQVQETEFSTERIQSIVEYAKIIGAGIEAADESFDKRLPLVEALNMTGELDLVNGDKWVTLHCVLGTKSKIVSSSSSDAASHGTGSRCT